MRPIDWQQLTREHDRAPERDSEEWLDALVALDRDPHERRRAEEADPLMIFRRLPGPRVGAGDIEAMKTSVRTLRQASETLAENAPRRSRFETVSRRWAWPLAALLAVAISAALLMGAPDSPTLSGAVPIAETQLADGASSERASSERATSEGALDARRVGFELRSASRYAPSAGADFALASVSLDGAAAAASLAAAELPLVEDADPGSDLLMQIENEEMSLVVVLTGHDV